MCTTRTISPARRPARHRAGGCTTRSQRWTSPCARAAVGSRWQPDQSSRHSPTLCARRVPRRFIGNAVMSRWHAPSSRRWCSIWANSASKPVRFPVRCFSSPTRCATARVGRSRCSLLSGGICKRWRSRLRSPRPAATGRLLRAGLRHSHSTLWRCCPRVSGPTDFPPNGSLGRPVRSAGWSASSTGRWTTTRRDAIFRQSRAPRGCRRICILASSRRARSGRRCGRVRRRAACFPRVPENRRFCARSAGESLRRICCTISRTRASVRCGRRGSVSPGARWMPRGARGCGPGSAGRPGTRLSMPACASSGRPAGCTTACAWSSLRFW